MNLPVGIWIFWLPPTLPRVACISGCDAQSLTDLPDDCEDYVRIGHYKSCELKVNIPSFVKEYALNLPAIETYVVISVQ